MTNTTPTPMSQPEPSSERPGLGLDAPTTHPEPPQVEFLVAAGVVDKVSRVPRSRNNLVALVVLGLILAVGLGLGSWSLLGSPWPSAGKSQTPVIAGLKQEPKIAWSRTLASPSTQAVAVGDDKIAIFDPTSPAAGVTLLSLATGKQLWRAELDALKPGFESQLWVRWLKGADRLLVDTYLSGESTKTVLILDAGSGKQLTSHRIDAAATLVAADDGTPLLIASVLDETSVSLLGSWDPSDVKWSTRTRALVGDGEWQFVVRDRELLIGQASVGAYASSLFCDAFSIDTGARPSWLRTDQQCFLPIGADVLVGEPDRAWEMRARDGTVRWSRMGNDLIFDVIDGGLYGVRRADRQDLQRYDPATGKELWQQAAVFDSYVSLTCYEGQLLALSSDEKSSITRLDSTDGRVESVVNQPTSFPLFLPGEGQLLAVTASPSGVSMAATPVRGSGISWSANFTEFSSAQQFGTYLVLRNTDTGTLSVLV